MDLEVLKSTEGLIKASQIILAFTGCIFALVPDQGHSFWTFVFVTTIIISGILLGLQVGTVQDFFVQVCHELHTMYASGGNSIFSHDTLESGINVPLCLLFFQLFFRGYGLIPDFIEPI